MEPSPKATSYCYQGVTFACHHFRHHLVLLISLDHSLLCPYSNVDKLTPFLFRLAFIHFKFINAFDQQC